MTVRLVRVESGVWRMVVERPRQQPYWINLKTKNEALARVKAKEIERAAAAREPRQDAHVSPP